MSRSQLQKKIQVLYKAPLATEKIQDLTESHLDLQKKSRLLSENLNLRDTSVPGTRKKFPGLIAGSFSEIPAGRWERVPTRANPISEAQICNAKIFLRERYSINIFFFDRERELYSLVQRVGKVVCHRQICDVLLGFLGTVTKERADTSVRKKMPRTNM